MNTITKPTKLSQIVRAMVNGLRDKPVIIDMSTYGYREGDKCFGCAAACALIKLGADPMRLEQPAAGMGKGYKGFSFTYSDVDWIRQFEILVDYLRCGSSGNVREVILRLDLLGIIKYPDDLAAWLDSLPVLSDDYRKSELAEFEQFALYLEQKGY